jgi:radical SAM superfamily enzyme YgiQ (UPF0313 family)
MSRLVFLAVNASYSHTSLAAMRLRGVADPETWEWTTLETAIADSRDSMLERVLALKPDVLATTFYLFNREWLTAFLARFRALSPRTVVIGGGPEWLGGSSGFFQPVSLVDAGVRGDGERAFRQWLPVWDRPAAWGAIPGLIRCEEGRVLDPGIEAERPDSADIPLLDARLFQDFSKPFMQMETSRGCRGGCLFCTSSGGGLREFPLDRVKAELEIIHAAGVRDVRVLDRTFNEEEARSLALLDLFRETGAGIRFHLEIDPARVTAPLADALRRFRPGLLHVEAGVQSLDEEVMRQSGRRGSPAAVLEGLRLLLGVWGLEVHADLVAGLPGSTWAGLKQDLTLLTLLGVSEIQLEILKMLPGTRLEARRVRLGLASSPAPPYEVLRTPAFSAGELWRAARVSRVVDGYHNHPALRALTRKACLMIPDFWATLADAVYAKGEVREGLSLRARFRIFKAYLKEKQPALVPELIDGWYRGDYGIDEELAPARLWRGALPEGVRAVEPGEGPFDRMVAVEGAPARYYAFKIEASGKKRLAAVFERAANT